jgi:hypothetical protein
VTKAGQIITPVYVDTTWLMPQRCRALTATSRLRNALWFCPSQGTPDYSCYAGATTTARQRGRHKPRHSCSHRPPTRSVDLAIVVRSMYCGSG